MVRVSSNRKVLNYWRNSIADGNRMDIDPNRLSEAHTLDNFNIEPGYLAQNITDNLFQKKLEVINKNIENKKSIENLSEIEILISPFYIITYVEHGEQRKNRNSMPVYPLWIPAILNKEGRLKPPHNNNKPWLNRKVMEPVNNYRVSVVLSTVKKVDNFLTHNEVAKDSWQDYWAFCRKFFTETTGKNWADIKENNFVSANYNKVLLDTESNLATAEILKLYDFLGEEVSLPKLFTRFSSVNPPELKNIIKDHDFISLSSQHYGHMDQRFPLSLSQRQALYHLIGLETGEILAVNGPPGTGKTTLLQNVIATKFVEEAVKGNDPPIIVAASNNNQAITNILDVFSKVAINKCSLNGRWLPDLESYGLYLPSKSIFKIKQDIPSTTPFGDGFPKSIENKEYFRSAKSYYLVKFDEYSGKQLTDIKKIVSHLQQELSTLCRDIKIGHNLWKKKGLIEVEIRRFEKHGKINDLLSKLSKKYKEKITLSNYAKKIRTILLDADNSEPLWLKWFGFLSFVKKKRAAKYQLIFSDFPIRTTCVDWFDNKTIYEFLHQIIKNTTESLDKCKKEIDILYKLAQKKKKIHNDWMLWKKEHGLNSNPPELIDELDVSMRHKAFQLATHYWEGRWLIECEKILFFPDKDHAKKKHEKKWLRYSMVTPCFITTFFTLPKFFKYPVKSDNKVGYTLLPHLEFIDLLIVDEAGQVSPEIGGASFAFAKKALVVGDVFQIEPIWRISPSVDVGNLQAFNILKNGKNLDELKINHDKGLTASEGSVMKLACHNTAYKIDGYDTRGFLLTEHRRCLPDIISYCNELVYKGALKALRKPEKSNLFPSMGYAHVNGNSDFISGSRANQQEATIIANWLKKHKGKITEHYNKQISHVVGIITPFAAQAQLIRKEINSVGLNDVNFKIGTVHALQGAEREIIIFSSVYGFTDRYIRYFFDQGPNMLNVAVSRAKDSFLVFGEMSLFDPKANTPSGILAEYLFEKEKNEILDIPTPQRTKASSILRISALEDHRSMLAKVFKQASEQVVIVSPFISIFAIEADNLLYKIKSAINRGVLVKVYTDAFLDRQNNKLKESSKKGRNALMQAGVKLILLNGVHNKSLIRDSDLLVEGSFNWLSAARNSNSPYRRHEVSYCYDGEEVSKYINDALAEMKNLPTVKADLQ
jgi:hypothetical protein